MVWALGKAALIIDNRFKVSLVTTPIRVYNVYIPFHGPHVVPYLHS